MEHVAVLLHETTASQALMSVQTIREMLNADSDSVVLGWDLRFCRSSQLLGNASAIGLGTVL